MRKIAAITIIILASMSGGVHALGLGDIEMFSALNQPLRAEIKLLSVRSDETDGLIATLASEEDFLRAGVARPFLLSQLRFTVLSKIDGSPYIEVTSKNPIVEPFLNFLVEIDWPRGRLVREYTVLLDPPTFMTQRAEAENREPPPQAAVVEAVEIDRTTSAVLAAESVQPEPVLVVRAAVPKPIEVVVETEVFGETEYFDETEVFDETEYFDETEVFDEPEYEGVLGEPIADGEYGPVKKGETLWSIANRSRTGSTTVEQMMIAISRANPEAFLRDNINLLREGAILRIPRDDTGITQAEAVDDFTRQDALWIEYLESIGQRSGDQPVRETELVEGTTEPAGETVVTDTSELKLVADEDATEQAADSVISVRANATDAALASVQGQLKLANEELESEVLRNEDLRSRVDSLEDIVSKMERLITLRETDLADLQRRLAESGRETSAAAVPATTDDVLETTVEPGIATPEISEEFPDEEAAPEPIVESEFVAEPEPVLQVEPVTAPTSLIVPETQRKSFLDQFLESQTFLAAGAGVVLLVLALIFKFMRRRKSSEEEDFDIDDSLMEDYDEFSETGDDQLEETVDSLSDLTAQRSDDDNFDAEDSDTLLFGESDEISAEGEDGLDSASTVIIAPEDTDAILDTTDDSPPASPPPEPVKDDTIAEADVYLAYGLFGQAEDLLKLAIDEYPDKSEYQVKLAETYYAEKNKDAFVEIAGSMRDSLTVSKPDAWNRIASMGLELAPENALFGGAEPIAKVAPELDFGIEEPTGGDEFESELDLDATQLLDSEQYEETSPLGIVESDDVEASGGDDARDDTKTAIIPPGDDGIGLADFEEVSSAPMSDGGVYMEESATGESENMDSALEEAMDFSIETFDETADSTVKAVDEVTSEDAMDFSIETFDEPTDSTVKAADDTTSEDAMDFSIETFDETADSTANAGDDITSDETIDFGIIELDETADSTAKVANEPEESNVLDFESDIDMDLDLEDLEFPEVDSKTTEEITVTDLDLAGASADADDPFAEFDSSLLDVENDEMISDASTEDLDATVVLDQAFEFDSDDQLTEMGGDADFGGEVDTMLDLAKAYIDMGDSDSATSALNEIISAGNDVQKAEAQNLLKQLS